MNADHITQLRLLDLQATDTKIAQLAHRRANLPELAALADSEQHATDLHNEAIDVETKLADVAEDQRRLESEVDTVRTRATRDEQRLQAGGLPSKELEGLQHELTTLARRQSMLEDELLDIMQLRENVEKESADIATKRAELEARRAELVTSRDAAFSAIDAEVAVHADERASLAAQLPGDLLALYERAREHGGGVGVSALRQRRCEGCHIELSGSELTSVRAAAADEVVRCDNCRRILVRTDESGL